jgi:hypothetical protein
MFFTIVPFFGLSCIKSNKSLNCGSKSTHVGSTMTTSPMTTLVKAWMSFLLNTMLIHWQEELNLVDRNACSSPCIVWKSTFSTMTAKVFWITSWIYVRLLLWMQHKRWIPIGLMGCVHTHQKILAIEGWNISNHVQNIVKKLKKMIQKLKNLIEL